MIIHWASDDLFGTKGIEYLLVIGFLAALVLFWSWLNSTARRSAVARASVDPGLGREPGRWFDVPQDLYYHQGHSWALPAEGRRVRVGVDDFAQKLLGRADAVRLPQLGTRLEQGGPGWSLDFGSHSIQMLSPVEGTVVERNSGLEADPEQLNRDPYGEGWLLEIETPKLEFNLRNLLRGGLARTWNVRAERALRRRVSGELGLVLQDGGLPVSGLARAISPGAWEELAREFLLTT